MVINLLAYLYESKRHCIQQTMDPWLGTTALKGVRLLPQGQAALCYKAVDMYRRVAWSLLPSLGTTHSLLI